MIPYMVMALVILATANPSICHVAATQHSTPNNDNLQTTPLCLMCNEGHHKLYYCDSFRRLSPQRRFSFVNSKNLFFICFSSKHGARNCVQTPTCRAAGCRYTHSNLLHFDRPNAQIEVKGADYRPVSNSYSHMRNNVLLPSVPVTVNFKINTWALIGPLIHLCPKNWLPSIKPRENHLRQRVKFLHLVL